MAEAGNAKIAAKLGSIIIFLFSATLVAGEASAQSNRAEDFVQRSGTHLTLGGSTFRYSGPNIEWLGLEGYVMGGGPTALAQVSAWVETIGRHVKQQDSHHLYLDTSGIFRAYPNTLHNKSPDLVTFEYYPHCQSSDFDLPPHARYAREVDRNRPLGCAFRFSSVLALEFPIRRHSHVSFSKNPRRETSTC
jgi:hypothetical protein